MSCSLNPYAKNGTFRNRKRQSPAGSAHKLSVATGPLSFDKSKMTLTNPCSDFGEWLSALIFEPELRFSVSEFITGFRKCPVSRVARKSDRTAILARFAIVARVASAQFAVTSERCASMTSACERRVLKSQSSCGLGRTVPSENVRVISKTWFEGYNSRYCGTDPRHTTWAIRDCFSARRGRYGRSLSRTRYAFGPHDCDQDSHRSFVFGSDSQAALRTRSESRLQPESSAHLCAA